MADIEQELVNDQLGYYNSVDIPCDCDLLWSLAHEFSYLRLSDKTGDNEYQLISYYVARARRIAATYARFYLETEDGGDPTKQGRHYWMALGAFASKTVACLLDDLRVQAAYFVGKLTPFDQEDIANGLGKGNLWLFIDIASSHWLYNHYPDNFSDNMSCHSQRDSSELETGLRTMTENLPWAKEAEATLNNFKPSSDIIEGFRLTKQIEETNDKKIKAKLQLDHLMKIADHEQGAVLQPLIYDDPDFSFWTEMERAWWLSWAAPTYRLVFTHACDTDDPTLKSVAPDDLVVENFKSRMKWIGKAAEKFHGLMGEQPEHMVKELTTIASWVNEPDAKWAY